MTRRSSSSYAKRFYVLSVSSRRSRLPLQKAQVRGKKEGNPESAGLPLPHDPPATLCITRLGGLTASLF
jgi:hypothetical protein